MYQWKRYLLFLPIFVIINCREIKTENPKKAYGYWTKSHPNDQLNIIHGNYWQSAHWSLEYKIYLEIDSNPDWWKEFKKVNNLIIDTSRTNESDFWEKPEWFNPAESSIKYKENSDFDQGSRYFKDPLNGKIFIYEIQL
ncbi:hypothetical protein ACM44_04880 [Chryseobacterium koreense CCUG 49689]|uniref:Uncharacterized protein n=1 Tax=Chryseobacterium koreense CCUG 49689 TaxID=1304281 RepID=A0A0J7LS50_9FLAO|nr:hypothetical protein ACM44_04880 [Chryseobacterium koreense CCUG 49689]